MAKMTSMYFFIFVSQMGTKIILSNQHPHLDNGERDIQIRRRRILFKRVLNVNVEEESSPVPGLDTPSNIFCFVLPLC